MKHLDKEHILKVNWERYRSHVELSLEDISSLVAPLNVPPVRAFHVLPGGCANTNYFVEFAEIDPLVLRIYTRDPNSLRRERDLHQLISDSIPCARFLFADDKEKYLPYSYAVFSYVPGILLRDAILQGDEKAMTAGCFQAGCLIGKLRDITFAHGGFFEDGLRVKPFAQKDAYHHLVRSLLKSSSVKRDLGPALTKDTLELIKSAEHELPTNNEAHLVHGDFDPSNIKIIFRENAWHLSGLLDWEFAFSGSYFSDIGQMMRYSHRISSTYEHEFEAGLRTAGINTQGWLRRAKLMDLLHLLQLLDSNPKSRRPNTNSDVVSLIQHTVQIFWPQSLGA